MSKRISTKYTGVFYRECMTSSKSDKTYYIVYKHEGKSKELKVGKFSEGIRENYCNQKRKEIMVSLRLGELPPILAQGKKKNEKTFDDLAQVYFEDKELTNRTNHRQKTRYESQLKPLLGDRHASKIDKNDIQKIQKELAKTRASKTVNGYLQFINTIFNHAIDKGIFVGLSPVQGVKEQKVDNKRERFLTVDEVKILLAELEHDDVTHLFVLLSLAVGSRLRDVLNISKKDINFTNNIVTIFDSKNQSTYSAYINNFLAIKLRKAVHDISPNDKVIQVPMRTLQRKLSKTLNRLFNVGLDSKDSKNRVVIHTLRHTFASHLAISGTPIFTIQKLLNHKDINMTLRYAKLAPDSGRDMVDKLINNFACVE